MVLRNISPMWRTSWSAFAHARSQTRISRPPTGRPVPALSETSLTKWDGSCIGIETRNSLLATRKPTKCSLRNIENRGKSLEGQGDSSMKYGVNMMVWTARVDKSRAALFSKIREWGFDGAELFVSPQEPADIPAVRKMLEKNQLECTTCSVLPRECHLVSPQPEVRARGVEFLKTCIDRTAELGARLVCGPMFAGLGVMTGCRRTPEEWNWAVEGLQVVAHHAQKHHVMVCLEPLNRFETYFLNTLEDAA